MKKLKFNKRAVLIDMDGVIVDSMPYHYLAWYEALRPLGVRVSCFDVYEREGERWDKSLRDFLSYGRIKPTGSVMKKVFLARQKVFHKYFKRTIFDGAAQFLGCLKSKGYILGLVTGTPIKEVERILPAAIKNKFEAIVTGDRVKHGKPHPEPFLKAAKELGLKPAECMVLENAPLGIRSAKAAGMYCIGITTSLPAAYLKKADAVVDTLESAIRLINKNC